MNIGEIFSFKIIMLIIRRTTIPSLSDEKTDFPCTLSFAFESANHYLLNEDNLMIKSCKAFIAFKCIIIFLNLAKKNALHCEPRPKKKAQQWRLDLGDGSSAIIVCTKYCNSWKNVVYDYSIFKKHQKKLSTMVETWKKHKKTMVEPIFKQKVIIQILSHILTLSTN